ncbi:hypothetical protein ABTL38_19405, partial [Acinetobacter baumannii]
TVSGVTASQSGFTYCTVITPTVSLSPTSATNSNQTFTATTVNTGGGTVTYNFTKNGVTQQSSTSSSWNATGLITGDIISCNINIVGGGCLES